MRDHPLIVRSMTHWVEASGFDWLSSPASAGRNMAPPANRAAARKSVRMESSLTKGQAHHARARSQNPLIVGADAAFVQRHLASVIRRTLRNGAETERDVSLEHAGLFRRERGFTPC
jgi:hypothetical protein